LEDLGSFYRSLDLFAMISEPAGCPNASLEAMASGLPVVATDVGGAFEQIADGVTGRLVPRHDRTALVDALVALACNRDLRTRYGRAGRARVAALFDENRMVEAYCRILFSRNPS
jgi:glycosyltransferase involved in cell wall biosynthesis